jgi:hypothetical protein
MLGGLRRAVDMIIAQAATVVILFFVDLARIDPLIDEYPATARLAAATALIAIVVVVEIV